MSRGGVVNKLLYGVHCAWCVGKLKIQNTPNYLRRTHHRIKPFRPQSYVDSLLKGKVNRRYVIPFSDLYISCVGLSSEYLLHFEYLKGIYLGAKVHKSLPTRRGDETQKMLESVLWHISFVLTRIASIILVVVVAYRTLVSCSKSSNAQKALAKRRLPLPQRIQ